MGALTSSLTSIATGVLSSRARDYVEDSIDNVSKRNELRAQQDLALQNLQQKQANELEEVQEHASLDKEKIALDQQQAEKDRKASLKRAVARQRALSGARGVSGDSGSGEAILLGLFEESDDEREERQRLDSLRKKSLDQDIENRQRQNLLEVSQLRERQALERSLL